jgi:hypothetical protein
MIHALADRYRPTIGSTRLIYHLDQAYTDDTGTYTDKIPAGTRPEFIVDRDLTDDYQPGEYRYWISSGLAVDSNTTPDEAREYTLQDYARAEALTRGDWHPLGIYIEATIATLGAGNSTLRSSGIWGVPSDSDQSFLDELAADEYADLAATLAAAGVRDPLPPLDSFTGRNSDPVFRY